MQHLRRWAATSTLSNRYRSCLPVVSRSLAAVPPPLFATDLDGTLLRSDGTVSERTRAAVGLASAKGRFLFATGRPLRLITDIADSVGHRGWVVTSNGGGVVDLASGEYVRTTLLAPSDLGFIVADLRAEIAGIACALDRPGDRFGHDPGYSSRWRSAPGLAEVGLVENLDTSRVVKLLVRHEQIPDGDTLLALVRRVVGDRAAATRSMTSVVEITASGATKEAALDWVAAHWGLGPADATVFGDMPNDLGMLSWAGHGVAVANAHPEVLATANEVTASNDDDGVAVVIERLLA